MDDTDSRHIDSQERSNTRMDQDNEKNVVTPKAGANREAEMRIGQGAEDIDERKRNELAQEGRELDRAPDAPQLRNKDNS